MSSLLDVLHKRDPRSQAVTPAPEPARPVAQDSPPTELDLAPELELSTIRTTTLTLPDSPALDELTRESPRPRPAAGDTTAFRRWLDPDPAVMADLPPVPAAPVVRRTSRKLVPVGLALLAIIVVAAGFAAFQFADAPDEGFLAPPGELPRPMGGAQAVEAARVPADPAPVARPDTRVAAEPAPDSAEVASAGDEAAWYDQPALPAAEDRAAPTPVIRVNRGSTSNPLFEKLRDGYAALRAGDSAGAESLYRSALAEDANSVDALLGLATLAARGGRLDEARDLYGRVQRLDPKNSTATAALSALPGAATGSSTESQLKNMLRDQPDAAALHFALGLRYLADQRWPDAQVAFFEAVRHDPRNPDYAFNLAVSLDRLGQTQPAASYYQRAIELATGGQRFDVETARARLAVLRGGQG